MVKYTNEFRLKAVHTYLEEVSTKIPVVEEV